MGNVVAANMQLAKESLPEEERVAWEEVRSQEVHLLQTFRDAHNFLFGADTEDGFMAQLADIGAGSYYAPNAAEHALVAAATESAASIVWLDMVYWVHGRHGLCFPVLTGWDSDSTCYDAPVFVARSFLFGLMQFTEGKINVINTKIASGEWSVSGDGKLHGSSDTGGGINLREWLPSQHEVELLNGVPIPGEHTILDEAGIEHSHVYIENEGWANQKEVVKTHDKCGYIYEGNGRLARIENVRFDVEEYATYQRRITESEDYLHEVAYWQWLINSGNYLEWLVSQVRVP